MAAALDSAIRLTGAKLIVAHTINDLLPATTSQTAMVYTTGEDDRLQKILKITKLGWRSRADRPCFGYSSLLEPHASRENGCRSLLHQRRKRHARPASLRTVTRPKGSDHGGQIQQQSMGGRHMPLDEGRQGRDHGHPCGSGLLVEGRHCRDQQRGSQMERIAKLVETVPGVQTAITTSPLRRKTASRL